MQEYLENPLFQRDQKPWALLLSLVLISLGGFLLVGNVLALVTAMVMTENGVEEILDLLSNSQDHPEMRTVLLSMQGMASIGAFIVAPLIFYYTMIRGNFSKDFLKWTPNLPQLIISILIIVFSFMIVNTLFIEWNSNIKLPESLAGFEQWATNLEESLAEQTEYLTRFDSVGYFILALVVIAVLPGIGEELLFRGFLQNIFIRMFKNPHAGIWMSALLFSAIHFQFYGFIPRMLLGALFGYLYFWTGNLIVPIVAHFYNNAISLILLYVHQQGIIDFDVESSDALPYSYLMAFSIIFIVSIIMFRKNLTRNSDERLERSI